VNKHINFLSASHLIDSQNYYVLRNDSFAVLIDIERSDAFFHTVSSSIVLLATCAKLFMILYPEVVISYHVKDIEVVLRAD